MRGRRRGPARRLSSCCCTSSTRTASRPPRRPGPGCSAGASRRRRRVRAPDLGGGADRAPGRRRGAAGSAGAAARADRTRRTGGRHRLRRRRPARTGPRRRPCPARPAQPRARHQVRTRPRAVPGAAGLARRAAEPGHPACAAAPATRRRDTRRRATRRRATRQRAARQRAARPTLPTAATGTAARAPIRLIRSEAGRASVRCGLTGVRWVGRAPRPARLGSSRAASRCCTRFGRRRSTPRARWTCAGNRRRRRRGPGRSGSARRERTA